MAFWSFSCNHATKNAHLKNAVEKSGNEKEIPIGYKTLKLIGGLKRACKYEEASNELAKIVTKWAFSDSLAHNLLQKMRKVESNEWYASCTIYPCWYEGVVKDQDTQYEIIINAGGYVILTNESETLHFVLIEKSDLFIGICACCESD
jgi:hypothetical protein